MWYGILIMDTLDAKRFMTKDEMKNAIIDLQAEGYTVKAFKYNADETIWTESEIA